MSDGSLAAMSLLATSRPDLEALLEEWPDRDRLLDLLKVGGLESCARGREATLDTAATWEEMCKLIQARLDELNAPGWPQSSLYYPKS